MRNSYCYMPLKSPDGKGVKKTGAYCNWESVIAHAIQLTEVEKQFSQDTLSFVKDYVQKLIGVVPSPAPHWSVLTHMGGETNMTEYHMKCIYEEGSVSCIKIGTDGSINQAECESKYGWYDMGISGECYQPFRKQKSKTNLKIYHNPLSDEANKTASNMFKMNLFGEVTITTTSNEQSFMPRTRFISYTLDEFNEEFKKATRKRKTESCTQQAQMELEAFEKSVSKDAKPPQEIAKTMKMPEASGKKIAKFAKTTMADQSRSVAEPVAVEG